MGFKEGRIVLDSPKGAYYTGQTVSGKLIFRQEKDIKLRGLYVKIKGFCTVNWITEETRKEDDKDVKYTVSHDSHEEYINMKIYLFGGESGQYTLKPGNYEYPFMFRIPGDCPSSYEGEHGHVRYEVRAVLDNSFKEDQEKKVAVRVMAPVDLNSHRYCKEPVEFEFQDSYCCFCRGVGSCDTVVKLPLSGYCPGQNIPLEINCNNKGGVEISSIRLSIVKEVTYTATNVKENDEKSSEYTVAEIKKGPIPSDTTRNWTMEMKVPDLDVYNLDKCQYIDLDYRFKVTVVPKGCHVATEATRKIIIGTVPLVGFQDDVQNPLHDQMPQQITAVTQQPVSSYPPVVNAYPGGNPPQLIQNPPTNPMMNLSYPSTQPYPATNPPYSPYPAANSQYPAPNPHYPGYPPPYSGPVPPYQTSNLPYPQNMPNVGMSTPGNVDGFFKPGL